MQKHNAIRNAQTVILAKLGDVTAEDMRVFCIFCQHLTDIAEKLWTTVPTEYTKHNSRGVWQTLTQRDGAAWDDLHCLAVGCGYISFICDVFYKVAGINPTTCNTFSKIIGILKDPNSRANALRNIANAGGSRQSIEIMRQTAETLAA